MYITTCQSFLPCLLKVVSLHAAIGSSSRLQLLHKRHDEVRNKWYFENSHPSTMFSSRDDAEFPPNKVSPRSYLSVDIAVNDLTRILEASRDNRVAVNWMSFKRSEAIPKFDNLKRSEIIPKFDNLGRSRVIPKFDNPRGKGTMREFTVLLVCMDDDFTTPEKNIDVSHHVTWAPHRSHAFGDTVLFRHRVLRK